MSCQRPPSPRPAVPASLALLAAALLGSTACGGHRHTSAGAPPGDAGLPAEAGPPAVERCGPAAAAGSRCADAVAALGGLAVGARLEGGRVAEVAVSRDRMLLSLAADDGQVIGVEVGRPDPDPRAPPPLARTPTLSLFVRSAAPGALTPTWQITLVQSLADALARTPGPAPTWLAPLRDQNAPTPR